MKQILSEAAAAAAEEIRSVGPQVLLERPEVWVLLWSHSQNALHIEPLTSMHRSNLEAFTENRGMDYVPLFVGSRSVVDIVANAVRPVCHARADAHAMRREVI